MTAPHSAGAGAPAAPGGGTLGLAWLRREVGDVHRAPWRVTPERLAAYAAAVRAMVALGVASAAEDPGAALDPDRQPALRPWAWPLPGGADPAALVDAALAECPRTAAAVESRQPVAEFAATHVALQVLMPALAILAGDDPRRWDSAAVSAWCEAQHPAPGAEADFAASLVATAAGWAAVDAAFAAG